MRRFIISVASVGLFALVARPQTYVVPSALHPSIQAAINAAPPAGAVISIQPGVYVENLAVTNKSLTLEGVGRGVTIIDGGGTAPCLNVVSTSTFGLLTTVRGLTLQNGRGVVSGSTEIGGGIRNDFAGVVAEDCEVAFNAAGGSGRAGLGAGVSSVLGSLTLRRCVVSGNLAAPAGSADAPSRGGGVYVQSGGATIEDCSFFGNGATEGSGVYINAFFCTINRTLFDGNGALAVPPTSAAVGRGAVFFFGLQATLSNCLVINGLSEADPGVVLAGAAAFTAPHQIRGCTITANFATGSGPSVGAVRVDGVSADIVNTICWGNSGAEIGMQVGTGAGALALSHSDVQQASFPGAGVTLGANVMNVNPKFVAAANGDFHLQAISPLLDAGASAGLAGAFDLDGDPRIAGAGVDIGADERHVLVEWIARGSVPDGFGGLSDVLFVNGRSGDYGRVVHARPGEALVVDVAQPVSNTVPAEFIVWGMWEFPTAADATPLGFGLEPLCIPSALAFPNDPRLFTLTSTDTTGTLGAFYPALPAPLSLQLGSIPQAFLGASIALQGIIFTGPVHVETTNAVALTVRP